MYIYTDWFYFQIETRCVQEKNYSRLHSLNQAMIPLAVRKLFDHYFHSDQGDQPNIYKIFKEYEEELKDMKDRHIISPHQWKFLFPSNGMCILS